MSSPAAEAHSSRTIVSDALRFGVAPSVALLALAMLVNWSEALGPTQEQANIRLALVFVALGVASTILASLDLGRWLSRQPKRHTARTLLVVLATAGYWLMLSPLALQNLAAPWY